MTKNANNNATNFELRKFFLEYLEKAMNLTKNHPEYDISRNNYHLHSENAKLALSILDFQTTLNDLVADLKKVEIFIRRFPNKKFYEDNEIGQLDYIKYHYEVFIHKIHTILEVKKLAINAIYDIGLKERNCTWKNLKNQKRIKNSAISRIIEFYYKSFEHIIKHRHLNTHRAYFGDKTNDELKTDYSIYKNSEKFGRDVNEIFRRIMPQGVVNYRIREYKKERIEYIKSGTEIADTYVEQFITIILTEFFNKIMDKNVAQHRL